MKKYLFPLALALTMSSGTTAWTQESDGKCYDDCKKIYDACRKATPSMACYDAYVVCIADCDAQAEGGAPSKKVKHKTPN